MILYGSAQVLLNLKKKTEQFLKINPVTPKKTLYVKFNKTITALHFMKYDVLWIAILTKAETFTVANLSNLFLFLVRIKWQ